MSQNITDLTVRAIERLGEAAIDLYEGNLSSASIKRLSGRKALDTLTASHNKGEINPFAGDPDAVNFIYGTLSLLLEKQDALKLQGQSTTLELCTDLINDIVEIGTVLGFTVTIYMGDDDE